MKLRTINNFIGWTGFRLVVDIDIPKAALIEFKYKKDRKPTKIYLKRWKV